MQTNPVKAIRQYCLNCGDGTPTEVRVCPMTECPLYPFRMGKNPYRKQRILTEEQKEVMAARLAVARKTNATNAERNNENEHL